MVVVEVEMEVTMAQEKDLEKDSQDATKAAGSKRPLEEGETIEM